MAALLPSNQLGRKGLFSVFYENIKTSSYVCNDDLKEKSTCERF